MKVGLRTPSIKKSISARTIGKAKRTIKKSVVPCYGKKGMGLIKDPKKAMYNKVYNKTTVGVGDIVRASSGSNSSKKPKTTASKVNKNIQHIEYSPGTYKFAGYLLIVLSILIIIMSLLLTLAVPLAGIIGIIFGIFTFIYGRKQLAKSKQ